MQCNMFEAKTQLSKLVQAALAGEEVLIANNGVPVVRIVKFEAQQIVRKPGAWANLPKAADDWDSIELNSQISDALLGSNSL